MTNINHGLKCNETKKVDTTPCSKFEATLDMMD